MGLFFGKIVIEKLIFAFIAYKRTIMKKNATASQEEIKKLIDDDDTGFDYQVEESIKGENRRLWRAIFIIVFGIVTILVVGCMLSIYNSAYDVHPYFGYAVGILELILLFCLIGIPTIRLFLLPYYSVNKKNRSTPIVRHANARVVRKVSENLIEYHANTSQGYVSEDSLKALALSLAKGKRTEINASLKQIYDTDINRKVRSIILKSATKSFCCTAISQNDKIDALSVLFINIRMIKSILFAYGTRPSMYKLVKIYTKIIISSLVAYGMQNISVSNILTKFVKATASIVPALGTLIDSAVQGATGAILTLIIGYKAKHYVYKEFNMVVKEELEYDKSQYADPDLELALQDYNETKDIMQAQVQNARRNIEESAKERTKASKKVIEEEPIVEDNESTDDKRKRLASEDLDLLLGTGKTMKKNSLHKKELKGKPTEKAPKKGFGWSMYKKKDETKDVAADVVEDTPDDNSEKDKKNKK